ncbi:hypothetical protein C0991_001449, partial [Blastosporella zonata]
HQPFDRLLNRLSRVPCHHRYDAGITPADIYDIHILDAMRMADMAWADVDTTTIHNCWRKSGILPPSLLNPSNTIPNTDPAVPISLLLNNDPVDAALASSAEQITKSLAHLKARGVLHTKNMMSLSELLNPAGENLIHDDSTDKDICEAVLERHEGEQNQEKNGGDDDGEAAVLRPKPLRQNALQAAATLKDYIMDVNEPYARDLELLLDKFGRQTRLDEAQALKPTNITDYFTS